MRILAIDPGFDRAGFAVLDKLNDKDSVVFSECFTTNRDDTFVERLGCVVDKMTELIEKYKPDAFALEKIFFAKNQKTAIQIAEVRGAVLYNAHKHNLEIFEYAPSEIKLAITGDGGANKEQIIKMVKMLVNFEGEFGKIDDEFDAIAICITCSACNNMKR